MTTFNKLAKKFTAILKSETRKQDIKMTPYTENRFKRIIGMGVERIMVTNSTQNREKLALAENNIKHLVTTLSDKARAKGSYPNIGGNTLETVLDENNPLWPYA